MARVAPRPGVVRRGPAALIAALPLLLLVAGCGSGSGGDSAVDPSGSPTGPASPGGSTVQFRVVRGTGSSPADSSELQAYHALDCSHPVAAAPDRPVAACDAQGHKYLLGPAAFTGGVTSAMAESTHDVGGGDEYAVSVQLDATATATLAAVTTRLVSTRGLLAVVVGGRVVAAPEVISPVTTGALLLPVPGADRAAAEALAARLAP